VVGCERGAGSAGTPLFLLGSFMTKPKIVVIVDDDPPSLKHVVAELLTKGLPVVNLSNLPIDLMTDVAGSIMSEHPRRTAAMLRTYASIYGEPVKIVADIYDSVGGDKAPEKKGRAPEFIKDRNKKHWKRRK
jgi:hypothetical protein